MSCHTVTQVRGRADGAGAVLSFLRDVPATTTLHRAGNLNAKEPNHRARNNFVLPAPGSTGNRHAHALEWVSLSVPEWCRIVSLLLCVVPPMPDPQRDTADGEWSGIAPGVSSTARRRD